MAWRKREIEAMKLALEALENHCGNYKLDDAGCDRHEKATTALKEALAQPEQEPVVFKIYKPTPPRHATPNVRDAELPWVYDQDPSSGNVASMWVTPVKATTPPQRNPLTDEEIVAINDKHYDIAYRDFDADIAIARAIEAAHGIKENT